MNAQELRIGNYVSIYKDVDAEEKDFIRPVGLWDFATYLQSTPNDYSPIPLTEDWLVKFGFKLTSLGRELNGFHLEASSRVVVTGVLSSFSWEQYENEVYLCLL